MAADVRPASSQDLAPGSDFRRLYEVTMQRLDAAPVYFFGDDYYRELLDSLGENLLIAEVGNQAGAVGSLLLLMRHADRLHNHLSCSNPEDACMGSNNLVFWTATQFAVEQGLRRYHLGGGHSERDSLFKHKQSFGGHELEYGVSGLIIDPKVYESRVESRAKECDSTPDALLACNYFPAPTEDRSPVAKTPQPFYSVRVTRAPCVLR